MTKVKALRAVLLAAIFFAIAFGLFLFLKEVFSGRLIVRDYIFQIGRFQIRWYSVCIATGIFTAYFLARRRLKNYPITPEDLDEGVFWGVIFGILGARTYYVIFNWSYYSRYPSEIYKIWHGGLAIHGGFFAALLTIYVYSKIKKRFTFVQAADLFTSVLPIAQAIGRWGNFFNYEAYGRPTNLPWGMYVPPERRMPGFNMATHFHPTFLYESLWDLAVFVILYFIVEKRKRHFGETTALYLVMYSLGRFWIEGLRLDSLMVGHLRTAQIVSIVLIIFGASWYAFLLGKNKNSETNPESKNQPKG
ncbi:prolipoprotein diacylglyceryl transferase [Fervidobacterium pennivorans]|uniref:prolipoprotein diacylglyceryl transferase n=1 Tax=Fervidobacterium pennivorans TaxID=93466 RepID=UPI00355BD5F2